MKIKVADISEDGDNVTIDEGSEWFEKSLKGFRSADVHFTGPVTGEVFLQPIVDNVRAEGHADFKLRVICDRCLKEFEHDMNVDFNYMLEPGGKKRKEAAADVELRVGDLDIGYYYGGEIETNDVVLEAAILELPISVYCSESCRGLCLKCGKDLNSGGCGCEKASDEVDPRWAALRSIKVLKKK